MDDSILPRFFILAILLAFSAFFSASEAAFFSLSPHQLALMKDKRGRRGLLVNSLLNHPRKLLITIYIGNELVNVATAAVATSIAIKTFGRVGIAVAIGLGTFLLLICGEIIPKTLALKFAESFTLLAALPLKAFSALVQPVQKHSIRLAESIISFLGIRPLPPEESAFTEEEFKTIVSMGAGQGTIDEDERNLIHNVMEFGDKTVAEIMTPKIEMFTLKIDDTLDDILPRIMENFYSRVPVYNDDGETILGVLFTKDLNRLKLLPTEKFNLKSVLRSAIFIPESKKIRELLQDFKKQKKHLAIVLDEYGSVAGLVTLEDVLEELVGEIDSEMRQEENPVMKLGPHVYRVPATYSLGDFNRFFDSHLPEDDFDTIGGLVFDLFGRVPRSGETVTLGNFKFSVEKMKGPRILNLEITLLAPDIQQGNGKKISSPESAS